MSDTISKNEWEQRRRERASRAIARAAYKIPTVDLGTTAAKAAAKALEYDRLRAANKDTSKSGWVSSDQINKVFVSHEIWVKLHKQIEARFYRNCVFLVVACLAASAAYLINPAIYTDRFSLYHALHGLLLVGLFGNYLETEARHRNYRELEKTALLDSVEESEGEV